MVGSVIGSSVGVSVVVREGLYVSAEDGARLVGLMVGPFDNPVGLKVGVEAIYVGLLEGTVGLWEGSKEGLWVGGEDGA